MLPKQTRPAWREVRRFHATELKREGWTYDEIADALAVSKAAISKWMKLISRHGDAGLRAHPRKGASPRLTPAQLRLLPGLLAEGTPAYGFRGEVWTCERIARVIEWEFGVSYDSNGNQPDSQKSNSGLKRGRPRREHHTQAGPRPVELRLRGARAAPQQPRDLFVLVFAVLRWN